MDYSSLISIIPGIINTINATIASFKSISEDHKLLKKLRGTGIKNAIDKFSTLEVELAKLQKFRETLLFYVRFLPDTASIHVLSDKLYEMVQKSEKTLVDKNNTSHDDQWQTISLMYNSIKWQKTNQIVSRRDSFPIAPNSPEVIEIKDFIRDLENEFSRTDEVVNNRNVSTLKGNLQRISDITGSIKASILRHTEKIINSIAT